jgi:broad specificity phosphatase PhoE
MKLYFVRHGESEANLQRIISNRGSQYGLTVQGQRQAATLTHSLKLMPITALYSSPLLRAVETSRILARELNQNIQVTEALREYDCGFLEGKSDEDSWEMHRSIANDWVIHKHWMRKPENGESFIEIQHRFVPFIEQLTGNGVRSEAQIVLIGHGGLFRLMLPCIFANVDHEFAMKHEISHTECIVAEQGPHGLMCVRWGQIELSQTQGCTTPSCSRRCSAAQRG